MIALLAVFLFQQQASSYPDPDVTCIDIVTFAIANSETDRSIVAEGSILNRTPWEMRGVSIEITIIGDNKFPLGTLQRQAVGDLPARKGVGFIARGLTVPFATKFTHKMVIRYTLGDQERAQVYENLLLKSTKVYVDPEAGPKAGVMGYYILSGTYKTVNKQQVYSGDTFFIRLRLDGFDEKTKPEGTLEVTVSIDGKKLPKATRSISAASQKVDISKLPGGEADPKMIFYDGVRKDFHVGLLRLEEARRTGKVTLEVKFSGKGGVWTWPALEEPCLEALRPPDKK